MAIIEVKNLSKTFGPKVALDNVSLEIPEGKIWHGILGRFVPEDWAEKEMWVDRSETIYADEEC